MFNGFRFFFFSLCLYPTLPFLVWSTVFCDDNGATTLLEYLMVVFFLLLWSTKSWKCHGTWPSTWTGCYIIYLLHVTSFLFFFPSKFSNNLKPFFGFNFFFLCCTIVELCLWILFWMKTTCPKWEINGKKCEEENH